LNHKEFAQKVLEVDERVRFVSIYDEGEFFHEIKKGKNSYLTETETEISLSQAQYRWSSRKKMAPQLGEPIFAMAKYGKVFRFTLPLGVAGLILVSTEPGIDIENIIEKICKIRDKYE